MHSIQKIFIGLALTLVSAMAQANVPPSSEAVLPEAGKRLECKATTEIFRSQFTVKIPKQGDLFSGNSQARYSSSIQGTQDGEPNTFDHVFKDAVIDIIRDKRVIKIASNYSDQIAEFEATFNATINLKTLKGTMRARDNADLSGIETHEVPIKCNWKEETPTSKK